MITSKTIPFSTMLTATALSTVIVGIVSTLFYSYLQFWPFTSLEAIDYKLAPAELSFPYTTFNQVIANPAGLALWRTGANHALTLLALSIFGIISLAQSKNAWTAGLKLVLIDGLHEGLWSLFWVLRFNVLTTDQNHIIWPSTLPLVLFTMILLPTVMSANRPYIIWVSLNVAIFTIWLGLGYPLSYSGTIPMLTNLPVNLWENLVWFFTITSFALRNHLDRILRRITTSE